MTIDPKLQKQAEELLKELEEAKKAKDKTKQRKIRKKLRDIGYFISAGGFSEERKKEQEKKKKARKKNKKSSSKRESKKESSGKVNRERVSPEDYFEFDPNNPDWKDLNKQYRAYVKEYHPDAGGDEEIMKEINGVYEELKARYGKK